MIITVGTGIKITVTQECGCVIELPNLTGSYCRDGEKIIKELEKINIIEAMGKGKDFWNEPEAMAWKNHFAGIRDILRERNRGYF